jgi:2-polyprenyl-6-methoxyphenol hydroxylase-like FAD-dependent oxidoreductase
MHGRPTSILVLLGLLSTSLARAEPRKRLLVVGGGPAGLAAAITAKKRASEIGRDLEVEVFEARAPAGTRKNMIAVTRQTLDNLSWLGARLKSGETVQFLDRRTMMPESGVGRRGPALQPVRPDPGKVSGRAKNVLRQKNIATMPINGIEAELRREAAALGIAIRYHTSVEDIRDVDGGVQLVVNQGQKSRTVDGWMVVMAHGGDRLSAHKTDVPERPRSEPAPGDKPSLLARIGVVPRTDETIGSRMVARSFEHTGEREIRNRYESLPGVAGRRTHHVRLDGPENGGSTALLSELPVGPVDADAWSLRQARALDIETAPLGPAEEFYLALTSARSASDPSRRIAVAFGKGRRAAGAKLLVGESLRKSTPLTGKAAQVAIVDGIDAGDTIASLLAVDDVRVERALLGRFERGRVRATAALQRAALAEFRESGIEPLRDPGPRRRSLHRVSELRTNVMDRVRGLVRSRAAAARKALRARK